VDIQHRDVRVDGGKKNERVVQLGGNVGESDVVSSPHGSLIQTETRRKM
jgi:hypothetical protein